MKELDLRIPNKERKAEGIRSERLCWKINQMDPTCMDVHYLIKELLDGNLGEGSKVRPPLFINLGNQVKIGRNVSIMNGLNVMAAGGLEIEDDVRISLNCTIATNNHDMYERSILTLAPVKIKKNAWIGVNVTILPGVTVGENAVIGAGSVVTKDVPDTAVVAGVPAKVIRMLDADKFQNEEKDA